MSPAIEQSLAAVRELACQIFAETDCAECPEVARPTMAIQMPKLVPLPSSGHRWGDRPKQKRRGLGPKPRPRAGEVRLCVFLESEMQRRKVSRQVVYASLMSGKYPGVKIRRVAPRVVFVSGEVTGASLLMVNAPQSGEVSLKDFVKDEAGRTGLGESAIYMRLNRGAYSGLEFRRVNRRVVFVRTKELLTTGNG